MIMYHGAPCGGTREDARIFFTGRHGLVSFAHPGQLDIVQDYCASYILDNGAFSIWRKGGKLNVPAFYDWVRENSHRSNFDFFFIPDVIDGEESVNDGLIENTPDDLVECAVPIWHLNESLKKLYRLSKQWPVIAFGSSGNYANPGTPRWWMRINEAMEQVCDYGYPRCGLHGLRMMNPEIFTRIPFSSVDSTNATQNAAAQAKSLSLPETWQGATVIAWRLEAHTSPKGWHPELQQQEMML